jgi:phosphatidylserine/phosphatidylglycerophosphate/cardiolipin synthase-like enzyme
MGGVMRRIRCLFAGLLLCGSGIIGCSSKPPAPASRPAGIDVRFSPHGGCTDAIVAELNRAQRTIRIQAYSFTSMPIAKAIIDARKRGVRVEALLDKSNHTDKYSAATFLKNQGADVLIDARHAIAHNKIIIVDERVLLTGSFNFTNNAEESNAENLLIIRDNPDLIRKYLANFAEHRKHSEPYEPAAPRASKAPDAQSGPTARETTHKARYVGSRTSNVYHYADCAAVRTISPQNRVEYQSPPPGKRLHQGCPE